LCPLPIGLRANLEAVELTNVRSSIDFHLIHLLTQCRNFGLIASDVAAQVTPEKYDR
jgi:hypothetical protein